MLFSIFSLVPKFNFPTSCLFINLSYDMCLCGFQIMWCDVGRNSAVLQTSVCSTLQQTNIERLFDDRLITSYYTGNKNQNYSNNIAGLF
jgi:hypothetical protein